MCVPKSVALAAAAAAAGVGVGDARSLMLTLSRFCRFAADVGVPSDFVGEALEPGNGDGGASRLPLLLIFDDVNEAIVGRR
ncbi:hypothetical protein O1611_g10167 [Lasiodiplodia mahajangana]|uniref:Uncharacterized protein n=1 Tax=Lasiodiplodia mahajangana TaxID=1108764 RepID=A0ACC2J146_9PEZI|nr:hypothetical protein O1611_g10167 [Lasiodiplodia mahajangana]